MLNLSNKGIDAVRELQKGASGHLTALRDDLHEQMRKMMNAALEADHMAVHHATGYAKALRDVCMALEQAAFGHKPQLVEKPAPKLKPSATEATNAAR